ncbi:unnamed protein product [Dracunculus medinensis]|uniref:BTB domain-containing protein n=1 Tax=Dracunculus medinensis TaxID=318479 RepID=A0A0N4UJJ5_DRAME|nr:unnamed protein product [Dracunculus medinensis]
MLIANNNYRLLFKKICLVGNWKFVQKNFRDFVILANDGEIRTSKYLLYLSMEYFHELFTADSTLNSITLNFNREIIEKLIDFTYKGIFSFTIDKMNELDSIVQCIKLLKPLKEHIVLECIVEMLTEYLMKDWEKLKLDEVVQLLDVSYQHLLTNVFDSAFNLIINKHFVDFQLEYNEQSEGEKRIVYRRLRRSPLNGLLSPINLMISIYNKRQKLYRAIRFCNTSNSYQIIE